MVLEQKKIKTVLYIHYRKPKTVASELNGRGRGVAKQTGDQAPLSCCVAKDYFFSKKPMIKVNTNHHLAYCTNQKKSSSRIFIAELFHF